MNSFCCDCEFISAANVISVVSRDISSVISMIDLFSINSVTNLILILLDVNVSNLSDDRGDFEKNVKMISCEYEDENRYLILRSKTVRFCLNFTRFTNQSVSQIDSSFVRDLARCCLKNSSSELKLKSLTES